MPTNAAQTFHEAAMTFDKNSPSAVALEQATQEAGALISAAKHVIAAEKLMAEKPKRGLGRGLDALFADGEERLEGRKEKGESIIAPIPVTLPSPISSLPSKLPITSLIPSPFQPRNYFDESELAALADSIRAHGILQPLLVRAAPGQNGKYEIIGGERRWRAAQMARLHDVPVIIQKLDDRAALEIALIENIQRADLNAIEEAEGYERLIKEFGHTQEQLAKIVGKSRSHMTNILRLLTLPKSVRDLVASGKISSGHARAMVGALNPDDLAEYVIRKHWSVRQLEQFVAREKQDVTPTENYPVAPRKGGRPTAASNGHVPKDITPEEWAVRRAEVKALEEEMSNLIGLKMEIHEFDLGSGQVVLHFNGLDQLDDLLRKLTRGARA